jgi:hypothetical protein
MKLLLAVDALTSLLQGCSTVIAVADVTASTVI